MVRRLPGGRSTRRKKYSGRSRATRVVAPWSPSHCCCSTRFEVASRSLRGRSGGRRRGTIRLNQDPRGVSRSGRSTSEHTAGSRRVAGVTGEDTDDDWHSKRQRDGGTNGWADCWAGVGVDAWTGGWTVTRTGLPSGTRITDSEQIVSKHARFSSVRLLSSKSKQFTPHPPKGIRNDGHLARHDAHWRPQSSQNR